MRLLYPSDPINTKRADDTYAEEHEAARAAGFDVSLFSFEDFERGTFTPRPNLLSGEVVKVQISSALSADAIGPATSSRTT